MSILELHMDDLLSEVLDVRKLRKKGWLVNESTFAELEHSFGERTCLGQCAVFFRDSDDDERDELKSRILELIAVRFLKRIRRDSDLFQKLAEESHDEEDDYLSERLRMRVFIECFLMSRLNLV